MSNNHRPTILIVDDDESSRYLTAKILGSAGFVLKQARTGEEAIALSKQGPDLILLDVNLPDTTGFEVCRRLKSDLTTRDIPVLHLSATAVTTEDHAAGLESGADAYLTQPVQPGLLVATVKALLRTSRAEAGAREAAREWQRTFDAVTHGIALLDSGGRIVRCNRAMGQIVGSDPEKLIGVPHDNAIKGAEPPEDGWPFDRARLSGKPEEAEIKAQDRFYRITADPLTDENGRFTGAVRTMVDVTERRREERERERLLAQLAQERARLETVVQQLPAGVVFADASGRTLMANDHFAHIMRLSAAKAAAVRLSECKGFRHDGRRYQPDDWPLSRSLSTGEVVTNEEVEVVRGDNSRCWLLVSSAPVRDRSGYITAAVVTFHDITERRQLEDQLRQSQKMEAVGRLAGGVAHDFNNLLTIIGGYGQMLLDTMDPSDPMHKDMEAIMEAANRASSLTKQLLTVSRRQVVQPKVFELNRLISRTNRMLRRVIGEDVELVNALQSDKGRIKADPGQIEQVLLNLTVNARDAMPKGGRLTIETADVHLGQDTVTSGHPIKAGQYVLLALTDTGTGMTPEVLSHLFEPFFTTKPRGKGTGLGLSTVYGIIKQNGAEIVVDSEPGRGTTFRIFFPAVRKDAERSHDPLPIVESSARRGSETVLLVEDEEDVRRLAAEMLTRQGYSIIEAESGAEALRLWEQHREHIDMLLTDVVMPKMSGPELAGKLKAKRPDLKIMYMSGYTEDVIASHGGIERTMLLQKPFTSDSLARAVRSVLDA